MPIRRAEVAEDSLEIAIAADAEEELGRILEVLIRDSTGKPLADSKVYLMIDGDGTFDAPRDVTQVEDVSDRDGRVLAIWYEFPRYLPRRALKSTVRARCDAVGSHISIADLFEHYKIRRL